MMKMLVSWSRALVVVVALAFAPAVAEAQTNGSSVTVAGGTFDAYRAMAITAGVVGGAVVATVLTEGLILPLIGGGGAANAAAKVIAVSGTVFGAVAGGLYADAWYARQ